MWNLHKTGRSGGSDLPILLLLGFPKYLRDQDREVGTIVYATAELKFLFTGVAEFCKHIRSGFAAVFSSLLVVAWPRARQGAGPGRLRACTHMYTLVQ